MIKSVHEYCSWCLKKGKHELGDTHWYSRDEYICRNCGCFVVKCRACNAMAKGRFTEKQVQELEKIAGKDGRYWYSMIVDNWHNEYCAQHNGTITDFKMLKKHIRTLNQYPRLLKSQHVNCVKVGTITAGTLTTAGIVTLTVTTGGIGAATASAVGKLGLLGTAGTGTVISSLSGAALSSASLAAIGGSVAAGTTIIAAVGAGLGGISGAVVANKYVGEDKYFGIHKIKKGTGPKTIFINGFLQQKDDNFTDLLLGHISCFPNETLYGVTWGSKDLYELGRIFTRGSITEITKKFFIKLGKKGSKKFNPFSTVITTLGLAGNPWHVSMVRAAKTGAILADAISRCNEKSFTLVGHSLGCRVIYYALQSLASKKDKRIDDVILLGGAVGKDDRVGWKTAVKAINGKIYNCFSENDMVLSKIYRIANANLSYPIGIAPIPGRIIGIRNLNFSSSIVGASAHMNWKLHYEDILRKIY